MIVLEDDPLIRSAIRSRLTTDGFRAAVVESVAEALEIAQNQPDTPAVFLSLTTPEGWRLHEALRRDEVLSSIPVVALTAEGYLPFGDAPSALSLERLIAAVQRVRAARVRRARAA